jgi:acetolactate synthase-1/2/3 large subunit
MLSENEKASLHPTVVRTGWHSVLEALKSEDVKYVFGVPGDMMLYDALNEYPEIKAIQTRHESSGVFMAYAYARLTGNPGVCYGILGPGVAQMTSGILEAYSAAIPLVIPCASPDQLSDGKGAFQENDQIKMLSGMTKWSIRIPRTEKIPWAMRRAFSIASNGKPGPVFLDLPKDVGSAPIGDDFPRYVRSDRPIRTRPDLERVKQLVDLLQSSEAPVMVAGGGAISSRAFSEVAELAELLAIPILTTPSGRGIVSEDHPLAVGLVGLYRTQVGKDLYENADLLLGLGTRFEEFQSGSWKFFPPRAKYVQVDIDHEEIGRNWIPDLAIVGDIKLTLRDIIDVVKSRNTKKANSGARVERIKNAKKEYEAELEAECAPKSGDLRVKMIVKAINRIFGPNTILVNENGSLDLWSYYYPYYKVQSTLGCIAPGEETCMGFGVAAAIGAKITARDKNVVCTTGDGAFQMQIHELATAAQHKAGVTWIILNNFSLGWVKYIWNLLAPGRNIATDFTVQPKFEDVAVASGCLGRIIEKPGEIDDAFRTALKANAEGTPAVLNCIVRPLDYNKFFREFHLLWGASPASISA